MLPWESLYRASADPVGLRRERHLPAVINQVDSFRRFGIGPGVKTQPSVWHRMCSSGAGASS